ncbi:MULTISPECIES: DUF6026 family protein [Pseudomonas]|jgi:cell division protein FtsB|uniref:DUF6026 family protein n=1 Tax=Pseudomonas TaxID=286 RepID=UPI000A6815FF|nr:MULTISPECIES: DUF6026 family protein [Pseudomonas]QXN47630.1 hypothetical protein KW062_15030 [Pseudomonas fluorescens]WSO21933.1 DUF6026 family protein [Pseudomonas fluorescens]
MGTVVNALPPQTLYVTIRRDELQQLKADRERLLQEVAQLRQQLRVDSAQPALLRPLD